jgi:L-asparaginase II
MTSTVDLVRGDLVESRHHISLAVVNAEGRLVASSGDPDLVAFWRSAAKPFQAIPLVADGAADALGVGEEELALACASHNGEPRHVEVARRLLARSGAAVDDLVCGVHASLSEGVAKAMTERGESLTRAHNNCSGKHAGMIALARHQGWGLAGYHSPDHPVQRRCLTEVAAWSGLAEASVPHATDGCGVPSFALPLRAMALAYARLGAAAAAGAVPGLPRQSLEAARRIVAAVVAHPFLVAGTGRLDTDLLEGARGQVFAKVGAEGVYSATIPDLRLGLALKVEDGATRAAVPALLALLERLAPGLAPNLAPHRSPAVRNTLGGVVGRLVARVELHHAA